MVTRMRAHPHRHKNWWWATTLKAKSYVSRLYERVFFSQIFSKTSHSDHNTISWFGLTTYKFG